MKNIAKEILEKEDMLSIYKEYLQNQAYMDNNPALHSRMWAYARTTAQREFCRYCEAVAAGWANENSNESARIAEKIGNPLCN